ncbi:hypothetical protein PSPO01_01738 [Paraphaeosphaeria sporulosa]
MIVSNPGPQLGATTHRFILPKYNPSLPFLRLPVWLFELRREIFGCPMSLCLILSNEALVDHLSYRIPSLLQIFDHRLGPPRSGHAAATPRPRCSLPCYLCGS